MICEQCGTDNPGWRAFCLRCGKSLGILCRCSFPNQPGDQFCGGCGQSLDNLKQGSGEGDGTALRHQLSTEQIESLMKESLEMKFEGQDKIDQDDIDRFFE